MERTASQHTNFMFVLCSSGEDEEEVDSRVGGMRSRTMRRRRGGARKGTNMVDDVKHSKNADLAKAA